MTFCNVDITSNRVGDSGPVGMNRRWIAAAGFGHGLRAAAFLLACAWAGPSGSAIAQEQAGSTRSQASPSPGPLGLKLAASTRAAALGGAFWTGDGADAVLHHPALIGGEGFGGSRQRIGGATHLTLSGSGAWLGGAVSAGVSLLEYGTSADSPLELPRRTAALIEGGGMAASEYVAALGYADEMFGVDLGVAAKLIGQRLGGLRGSTTAVDVGAASDIGPFTAALSVQNLGRALKVGRYDVPLARRVVLDIGSGGRVPAGPLDMGAAVRVAREGGGEIVPGGGVEIAWWPVQRRIFIARVGLMRRVEGQTSPFTFGAGFEGDRIRIDYAYGEYMHEDLSADSHRIGIAFR